jgi:hypothetical protein
MEQENQVYSTYTGDKVWESNPIGKTGVPSGNNIYGFTTPSKSSQSGLFNKGLTFGQVRSLGYETSSQILFAYMPDYSSVYKWYPMKQLTLS